MGDYCAIVRATAQADESALFVHSSTFVSTPAPRAWQLGDISDAVGWERCRHRAHLLAARVHTDFVDSGSGISGLTRCLVHDTPKSPRQAKSSASPANARSKTVCRAQAGRAGPSDDHQSGLGDVARVTTGRAPSAAGAAAMARPAGRRRLRHGRTGTPAGSPVLLGQAVDAARLSDPPGGFRRILKDHSGTYTDAEQLALGGSATPWARPGARLASLELPQLVFLLVVVLIVWSIMRPKGPFVP